ncbi:MAG: TQO small subunit DoxD [Planctomycetota bacterium]|nr:TQO small subunit DoxD [Planctomycetota bacterium]
MVNNATLGHPTSISTQQASSLVQLNKFHIVSAFLFLAALRIAVGFHFFDQGHQKYRQGGFDSTGFLKYASGPFAPLFHSMVPDYDGKIRLCYDSTQGGVNKINSQKTLEIWKTYKNYIVEELIKEEKRLLKRREETKSRIEKLSSDSEDYLVEKTLYQRDEKIILAIRKSRQSGEANRVLQEFAERLEYFLAVNEEEINYYFLGAERLDGFRRDYDMTNADTASESSQESYRKSRMKKAANKVPLLRDQVKTIGSERSSAANGWLATIDGLWEGFEFELLSMVPLDSSRTQELRLVKPSESGSIALINRIIPYFDMTVGGLLILGLFTRLASLAAGCFLVSVLMTQPAILGEAAVPTTILYLIEMFAAFVIFATCAGRYAGLDYFVHSGLKRIIKPETEDLV